MSLRQDSPASHSAQPDIEKGTKTNETCGQLPFLLLERCSLNGAYWRTSQDCFLNMGTSGRSLKTWPRRGSMRSGTVYQRKASERRTKETGFGYSLPTPTASSYGHNQSPSPNAMRPLSLETMARKSAWPTPRASDWKGATSPTAAASVRARGFSPNLQEAAAELAGGGPLNPAWVEWLMGWPIGATALEPLGMDRYQEWLSQHGKHLYTETNEDENE